jgi:glycosyltransferase involved in cell wall biosynthesis
LKGRDREKVDEKVTVLMPSYNPGKYLRNAVESVFNQSYQNWKMVIVDDASTDDSLSTIQDYLSDSRLTLIRNKQNLGQSKTQNAGLAHIETEFTIMLDSDDWFFPDTLEILVNEADKLSEDIGLICGKKTIVMEDDFGEVLYKLLDIKGSSYDDPYEFLLANFIPYPRFYRTAALKKVGGWPTDDPYEGRYLEDRRMDVLLIEHYKIHWIDQMLYNYRKHINNVTVNKKNLLNDMIKWNIHYALRKWGDKFEPQFKLNKTGWVELTALTPK